MQPRFFPWIPEGDPRFGGVRLLVLGESHYEEGNWIDDGRPLPSDYTIGLVRNWGVRPPARQPFYAGVYSALTGQPWEADQTKLEAFWNSVLHYNYVQRLVPGGARAPVPGEFWSFSEPIFRTVLEELRPEAIIVTGRRLWRSMADEDVVLRPSDDPMEVWVGYRLSDGRLVSAMHIRHPSSPGFDWRKAAPSVEAFLQEARAGSIGRNPA